MSDAAATVEATTNREAANNRSWGAGLQIPWLEIPNVTLPTVFRDLVENGAAQARESCEVMKATTRAIADMVENANSKTAGGVTDLTLKLIDVAHANSSAAFAFAAQLMTMRWPWELGMLSAAHTRQRFEAICQQSKELTALGQKIATQAAEPMGTGASQAFKGTDRA